MDDTIEKVIDDLESYTDKWNNRFTRGKIPYEIRSKILTQIVKTGSIDTTRFIRAVDFREEGYDDGYRYLIDASSNPDVTYDDVLERDGVTRKWKGRFNYRDGIRNSNLQMIFDEFADTSFAR